MGETSIIVGQHKLSLEGERAIFIDGRSVQIQEVSEAGIVLEDRKGQRYTVSGQDFYRLVAGGVEPDKKLVGELMAKDMMCRQKPDKPELEPEPAEQPKQSYQVKKERLIKG